MINYVTIPNTNLRELCIEQDWFTCGTCEQYDKLFLMNESGALLDEIATIIWLCSDDSWLRQDILNILCLERRKYLDRIHGCSE